MIFIAFSFFTSLFPSPCTQFVQPVLLFFGLSAAFAIYMYADVAAAAVVFSFLIFSLVALSICASSLVRIVC